MHRHPPTLLLGLFAAALIETLHPDFAWMGEQHSRGVKRVDGVPTGRLDPEGVAVRGGHSVAFFMAVAYGPTDAAERVTRAVNGMPHTIRGVRPDGRVYDADDPETLRWAYATVVWGIVTAHERYHPRPLRATKQEVLDLLDENVPLMGVRRAPRALTLARRAAMWSALNGLQVAGGELREPRHARARASATVSASSPTSAGVA